MSNIRTGKFASLVPEKIIDAHLHVASTKFTPRSFIQGVIDYSAVSIESRMGRAPDKSKLMDMYLSHLQDHDCSELLAQMDEAGIDQAILLLPDYSFALRDSELDIEQMFFEHNKILQANPDRFMVFAGVDPRWGQEGIDLFEKGVVEYGFKGLKIYPPCGYSASDKSLYPFYEICRKHRLPVLLHVGGTSPVLSLSISSPLTVDDAAKDFPDVNFILAHGSVAFTEECIMLCSSRPNVYLDISTFQKREILHLSKIFNVGINHKIIFGTDWPIFRLRSSQSEQLSSLFSNEGPILELDDWDLDGLFYKTIERLLP